MTATAVLMKIVDLTISNFFVGLGWALGAALIVKFVLAKKGYALRFVKVEETAGTK